LPAAVKPDTPQAERKTENKVILEVDEEEAAADCSFDIVKPVSEPDQKLKDSSTTQVD